MRFATLATRHQHESYVIEWQWMGAGDVRGHLPLGCGCHSEGTHAWECREGGGGGAGVMRSRERGKTDEPIRHVASWLSTLVCCRCPICHKVKYIAFATVMESVTISYSCGV
jgi:hypothetical protein